MPATLRPEGVGLSQTTTPIPPRPLDLSKPDTFVRGTTEATVTDTRTFANQIQEESFFGEPRRVREVLPPHEKPVPAPEGAPNGLTAGKTLDEPRTIPGRMFPSVGQTAWNPPDPALAVGPSHVVVTVNSRIGFFTRAGVQTFAAPLDSTGSPGFFEPLGAGGFVFDPKCFYDHLAGRFVVVVLETYGSTESWVDIAVSDDSDPNGIWYKYRTNAVIDDGTRTYWWDFPGAGYDQNAYYVTGNLFGLSSSGYGGFGVRVFDKAGLLSGGPAVHSTLRASGFTIQPALHYGNNAAGFMATVDTSTNVKVWAVTNPLTTPALVSASVAVPSHSGAIEALTLNGSPVSNAAMTMPYWRNGRLFMCHNASIGTGISARNVARWHEFDTGSWPTSGTVTRVQSGDVDAGANLSTLFPAIAVNAAGDVGMALGTTSETTRVAAAIAGRRSTDPAGRMGAAMIVKPGDTDAGGRWGDYYAVSVDPTDDTTFWTIGEYRNASGWQNWVGSFTVSSASLCHPLSDDAGLFQIGVSGPRAIDVLANDWHSSAATLTISAFDASSALGGTVTRSVGTGPGGRDRLVYTPPASGAGNDSFNYTVSDGSGNSASAAVVAQVFNPTNYRNPETVAASRAGVLADWYDLPASPAPANVPNFSTLARFGQSVLPNINVVSTNAAFSTSGRIDLFGGVFEGYINAPASDVYRFYMSCDQGARMYLGGTGVGTGTLIIDNSGSHGVRERVSNLIGLKPGRHRVRVEYYENNGAAALFVSQSSTASVKAIVPASSWSTFCGSDFNRTGDVSVQDIFDYLAAYFSGSVRGDFNGVGGVSVQDIFDFLAAYFAGC